MVPEEGLFNLFLRRRDQRMAEAPAQVHGHQRHDFHRLAGAGWLFDQNIAGSPADIGDQADLVITEFFGVLFH